MKWDLQNWKKKPHSFCYPTYIPQYWFISKYFFKSCNISNFAFAAIFSLVQLRGFNVLPGTSLRFLSLARFCFVSNSAHRIVLPLTQNISQILLLPLLNLFLHGRCSQPLALHFFRYSLKILAKLKGRGRYCYVEQDWLYQGDSFLYQRLEENMNGWKSNESHDRWSILNASSPRGN